MVHCCNFQQESFLADYFPLWGWSSVIRHVDGKTRFFYKLFFVSVSMPLWALACMHCILFVNRNRRQCYSQSMMIICKMQLKVMAGNDLKYQLCRNKHQTTNNIRVQSSLSRDIKNNGTKAGLLVYPELPEYTASLTSLLGLILVTELTRGGVAQLNALYNPIPRMHTHLACSKETGPRRLSLPLALNPHKHQHVHEGNEIFLNALQGLHK